MYVSCGLFPDQWFSPDVCRAVDADFDVVDFERKLQVVNNSIIHTHTHTHISRKDCPRNQAFTSIVIDIEVHSSCQPDYVAL
jgi:hypothetical protein